MERLTGRFEHPVFPGAVTVRGRRLGEAYFDDTRDYRDYADALDKLAAYEDAEEQGRLIVLPCKVGDMAYYRKGQYIYGDDVKRVVLDGMDNQVILDANHCYLFSDFGSKVFLSREAAEKELEGMKCT